MELMETLEELKDLNERHAKVDLNQVLLEKQQQIIDEIKQQEEEDEAMIRFVIKIFSLFILVKIFYF